MIPRTGIVAGAGPLAAGLLALDPDAVLIRFHGVASPARAVPAVQADIARLGAFFDDIHRFGLRELVFAGRFTLPADFLPRPGDSYGALSARITDPAGDARTQAFLKQLVDGVVKGSDAVGRALIGVLEEAGYEVLSPFDAAPALRVTAPFHAGPVVTDAHREAAILGAEVLEALAPQAFCTAAVTRGGQVLAVEAEAGLAPMLAGLAAPGGVLTLAGWPGQDLRLAMPTLGPETVAQAARAGLIGIVFAAGGVAVIDAAATRAAAEAAGIFLLGR